MKSISVLGFLVLIVFGSNAWADPVGAPGIPHRWGPAAKEAIGTAYEANGASSPVWFTVAQGILTEVFYPTVDRAQVGDLQFLVSDGSGFFSEQKTDTDYTVSYNDEGMAVHITGTEKAGKYSYDQWIVADPAAPVIRIHTAIRWREPGMQLYVLFKPAIGNTASKNLAMASDDALYATRQDPESPDSDDSVGQSIYAALVPSTPFVRTGTGYVGFSDGWQDISKNFRLTETSPAAGPGNVALTGQLPVGAGSETTYDLALSFGTSQNEAQTYGMTSLSVSFNDIRSKYESGWKGYLQQLTNNLKNARFITESPFARRSAAIIKMHEDKRNRGAIIASMSSPGIPDSDNAMDGVGGYHLVWPRDLYHAAMGLFAAGDRTTPVDVLHYLENNQRSDGSWYQNFWIDGTPYWQGLQMDEVSFPILLAGQLKWRGVYSLSRQDLNMISKAAGFIISHGPATQEDRWEEIGGYVPSTIAAEVAALRVASSLTGDPSSAQVAEQWQAMLERWTMVTSGQLGQNYYIRVSPSGQPDSPEPIQIANGGGSAYASEILDGGFLDLVRMGLRDPRDPRILNTLRLYENPDNGIAAADPDVPEALTYRRYSRDEYGYHHVGGYWPLLAGEKGDYDIAAGNSDGANAQLFILEKSASANGLLPEQTNDAPSSNASVAWGVAQPLVWAHAEDILLHRGIEEGKVFDAPRTGP